MPTARMVPHPEPMFIEVTPGPLGQRFALLHSPNGGHPRGLIVYVHPFAEEMNKSRRMAALQSRALAAAGYAVLQMDLLGCGDSAGDFGDATWAQWVDDVVFACRWLRRRHPTAARAIEPPMWLWGLRAGCLLVTEAARRLDDESSYRLLFWQPTAAGKLALQQFLRLKAAADMLGGSGKGVVTELRRQLAAGVSVEVAGYGLSPALAAGLEQATLRPPECPMRVEWLEVSGDEVPALSPASVSATGHWRQANSLLRTHIVRGPAFWQTTEIEDAPALLTATLDAVDDVAPEPVTPAVLAPDACASRMRA